MTATNLNLQVDQLVNYLVNLPVKNKKIYELYQLAVVNSTKQRDEKIINFAFRHTRLIPFLDAGLVFVRPYSELRRRIYITFAIIESMPEYADHFLPKKTSFMSIIIPSIRAVLRAIVGFAIIKVGRL